MIKVDIFRYLVYHLNYDLAITILKLVHKFHLKLVCQELIHVPLKRWYILPNKEGIPTPLYKHNPHTPYYYDFSKTHHRILLFRNGYWISYTEIRDWRKWWVILSPHGYFYPIKVAKRLFLAKPYFKTLLTLNGIPYPNTSSVEDLCKIIMKKLD